MAKNEKDNFSNKVMKAKKASSQEINLDQITNDLVMGVRTAKVLSKPNREIAKDLRYNAAEKVKEARSRIKDRKKIQDKRERLKEKFRKELNQLFDKGNIQSAEKREQITRSFMAAAQADDSPSLELPKKPKELWKSGQGETALEFMQRVYEPYLEAGILTWQWLGKNDPKLMKAASASLKSDKNNGEMRLPLTESELLDREHEALIKEFGHETLDRIFRVKSSLITRKSRQNKKAQRERQPE